ncbi:MAG: glycosyltransferase family 4 protein [Terriglobia bacterium]
MKIAVIVQGRFHAFDLARALMAEGHEVTVLTNYPVWATKRFGLPPGIIPRFFGVWAASKSSPWLHRMFGKWAAREIQKSSYDLVHAFTGVAEESIRARSTDTLHFIVRGSAHIRVQDEILRDEAARCGVPIEHPTPWMIAREQREYEICDRIVVLSSFALQSFLQMGVDPAKMICIPLGVDVKRFRADAEAIAARRRRILSGEPLRVLYTGNLQFQKGLRDLIQITQTLRTENFRFQLIGTVTPEAKALVSQFPNTVELVPRQPQNDLPRWYAGADLYIFPTIQDGFAVVLTQASASGLPILTTTNCAGPDMVEEGVSGWVLPIRDPEAFVEKLRWCDRNREQLAEMIELAHGRFRARDWSDVARGLGAAYTKARQELRPPAMSRDTTLAKNCDIALAKNGDVTLTKNSEFNG